MLICEVQVKCNWYFLVAYECALAALAAIGYNCILVKNY
jgi:hypothetical protein